MTFTEHEIEIILEIHNQLIKDVKGKNPVSRLVSNLKMSESTARRGFKFIFKKTINQYRIELAMAYAKQLLEQGEQIKVVKIELGYSYKSKFNQHFKKIHGYNPSNPPPAKDLKSDLQI
jgi:methylphosphotriester-DNA--protein-cysteine methyltransferase